MALDCFNKVYEIVKNGKQNQGLNLKLNQQNLESINEAITETREALIKKLADLQKTTIEVTKATETV